MKVCPRCLRGALYNELHNKPGSVICRSCGLTSLLTLWTDLAEQPAPAKEEKPPEAKPEPAVPPTEAPSNVPVEEKKREVCLEEEASEKALREMKPAWYTFGDIYKQAVKMQAYPATVKGGAGRFNGALRQAIKDEVAWLETKSAGVSKVLYRLRTSA